MFSEAERRKVLRSEVICYIPGNFEAGNSLNLAVTVVVQHLLVTMPCYPLTSEPCCLLRDFGGKQFYC